MKLGIDFGTCFSFTAACTAHNGLPNPLVGNNSQIYDRNGGIPTVFYNDSGNREIMGKKAAEMSCQFPQNGVAYIKRDLRDKCPPDKVYTLRGTQYNAKSIIVKYIKFLITNAANELKEQYPGENSALENIVVAVPAMSAHSYREFIRECVAEASGLNVKKIDLIDEPVAAALSYYGTRSSEKIADGSRILTYDLGGGTFDTAVVEYNSAKKEKFIVLAQSGDTKIGGTDWDKELLTYIKTKTKNTATKLTERDEYALLQAIIEAKIQLSDNDSITFSHFAEDTEVNFLLKKLTRKKFEELTKKYLVRTISTVQDVIKEYRTKFGSNAKIDAIVLSGGASQMPMVRQHIQAEFPSITILSERPDRAIAFGAAIYAADLDNTVMVAPHTYGVDCMNRDLNKEMINNILFKGTPIHVHSGGKYISDSRNYVPRFPDQTAIRFDVYESNEPEGVEWIDFGDRKPMFTISVPVKRFWCIKTVNRSFTAEIRLLQGGILELHVYDNDQKRTEVGFHKHQL